ncbi:uncharacterized protein LOC113341637 [Papaver somniferum]|uniref:uncharacterized protein LOC113341637 n=1 Tax=Papaver somniferum TaxID=3469 RepID=UPI000E6FA58E|nr:uncharacterized protein LOC113341637 [Papaver somniferum]
MEEKVEVEDIVAESILDIVHEKYAHYKKTELVESAYDSVLGHLVRAICWLLWSHWLPHKNKWHCSKLHRFPTVLISGRRRRRDKRDSTREDESPVFMQVYPGMKITSDRYCN